VGSTGAAARRDAAWRGSKWKAQLRHANIAGHRMRYLDVGTGPAVLLVHGLGASWQVWYETIPDLVDDHRVIAVDLPGFGGSESMRRAANIESYAEALQELLEHAGIDRVLVVGHSLGGLITQRLAAIDSERVAGLVLVATGDGQFDVRQEAAFRRVAAMTRVLRVCGPPLFILRPAVRTLLAVPPLRRRLVGRAVHDPATIPADLVAHMVLSVYRSPALADAIRAGLSRVDRLDPRLVSAPTLIISGDRDRVLPRSAATRLADGIPNATHETWDDVGHHPMLERPARFNERLRAIASTVLR
jgi:pimeloyl-ACP methyl ester carboxylesterase